MGKTNMENAIGHYVPTNNSCERGLRAELRANLLGRHVNGGRRPITPDAPIKLTAEQATWLNTVCDHAWPEYQAIAWAERTVADNTLVVQLWPGAGYCPPARELQELLNRLDEDRDARDAAEFDADPELAAFRSPLGQSIARAINPNAPVLCTIDTGVCEGAAPVCGVVDEPCAHRYGALAEETAVVRPTYEVIPGWPDPQPRYNVPAEGDWGCGLDAAACDASVCDACRPKPVAR
jgi:hypothetical protein